MGKIAIISINKNGERLARRLTAGIKNSKAFNVKMDRRGSLKDFVAKIFNEYDGIIFIAALGIVVRLIGPLLKDKLSDPAVVAIDTAGRFAISALSGHEGGANDLVYSAAGALDALPVVTTGAEVHKRIIVGIGSRRGISANHVKRAIAAALGEKRLGPRDVRAAATVDLKRDEAGIIRACRDLEIPLVFIPKSAIKNFKSESISRVVRRNIGLDGVCEPAALLAGRRARLILKKRAQDGVTVAIARESSA